jgi:hypothetical protein
VLSVELLVYDDRLARCQDPDSGQGTSVGKWAYDEMHTVLSHRLSSESDQMLSEREVSLPSPMELDRLG